MEGWIKLHRKITEWDWYDDANTFRLFIHLLLLANSKDTKWRGVVIKRGEYLTGRKVLAEELKISEQAIRTSLKHLESTNEIAIKSTNKFSIISICKYEDYQGLQPATQPTNNQQVTNEQPTTNHKQEGKEEKERQEGKEIEEEFDFFWNLYDKKIGDKTKLLKKWAKLKQSEKDKIFETLPKYVASTEKKYRKNPETYLNNEAWNDEIITDIKIKANGNRHGSVQAGVGGRTGSSTL